jgi:LPXTG-motif cell wall-anchored protein
MKKVIAGLLTLAALLSCVFPVFATGNVTYTGDAGSLIFAPGSEYSPTDLFPNFKDVMPGDSLSQPITVKNDASKKVKVKIYMRALGAHPDSEEFLGRLRLRVEKSADNTMGYMFDAAASEKAQLTDWVCLGTLYSGGEVNLHVILHVPTELDNRYQQQVGYLDWEFMVEEYEIEPTDPEAPDTGDSAPVWLWAAAGGMSLFVLLFLVGKRRKEEE